MSTKEPWEYTQKEFVRISKCRRIGSDSGKIYTNVSYPEGEGWALFPKVGDKKGFEIDSISHPVKAKKFVHRRIIEDALNDNFPVSAEVLVDYPDLTKPVARKPVEPTQVVKPKVDKIARDIARKEPWEIRLRDYKPSGLGKRSRDLPNEKMAIIRTQADFRHEYMRYSADLNFRVEGKEYAHYYKETTTIYGKTPIEVAQKKHKLEVQQALKEGKPVPDKVLADYPVKSKNCW